jgi:hypothetical protein
MRDKDLRSLARTISTDRKPGALAARIGERRL